MLTSPSPITRTRLEKAAVDNGFDQEIPLGAPDPYWLCFASSKAPLWVWLGVDASGAALVAFSRLHVAEAVAPLAQPTTVAIPQGARAVLAVAELAALHPLLRRAFQLARVLPSEPLRRFEEQTKALPRATEVERLTVQRVGQDIFRSSLLEYWDGRCAVLGLAVREILRASHIKPWAACDSDAERLHVFNGLLLAPHLDAVFDSGFVTVTDDGDLRVSPSLDAAARVALALDQPLRVRALESAHRPYLRWHRMHLFRGDA